MPKRVNTIENVDKVHNMNLDNGRLRVHELDKTIVFSQERLRYIYLEELIMSKVCAARYGQHFWNAVLQQTRTRIAQ